MIPNGTVPIVRSHRRRTVVLGLLGGGLTLTAVGVSRLVPVASARQADATPAPFSDQVFAGAGFVGEAQNVPAGKAFVGVVVAEAEPGAETREARALIYGENANGILEWFPGSVSGDQLDLVSENGARLTGEMTADGVTGKITLADGATVDFDLVPATGVAGLYTVTMLPGGRAEGTSERGATLTGQLTLGSPDEEHGRFAGTFTAPDGEDTTSFDIPAYAPPGTGPNSRLVVLADGQFRGGAKQQPDGQFSWSHID
jgi:hypothetical protein